MTALYVFGDFAAFGATKGIYRFIEDWVSGATRTVMFVGE
jgi:hypothetical protein